MAEHLSAPFTPDQVASLNAYQHACVMHPFTCSNRGDGGHIWRHGEHDHGILTATGDGWTCQDCDYTQDWAHSWMADGSWRDMFGGGGGRG